MICSFNNLSLEKDYFLFVPYLLGGYSPTIASFIVLKKNDKASFLSRDEGDRQTVGADHCAPAGDRLEGGVFPYGLWIFDTSGKSKIRSGFPGCRCEGSADQPHRFRAEGQMQSAPHESRS